VANRWPQTAFGEAKNEDGWLRPARGTVSVYSRGIQSTHNHSVANRMLSFYKLLRILSSA